MIVFIGLLLLLGFWNSHAEPRTLDLGGLRVREDAYRAQVKKLIGTNEGICRLWLPESKEPLTAYQNTTTDGASRHDLMVALAIFNQECLAVEWP